MKLRKPCEHGRYDRHTKYDQYGRMLVALCPGGEFLPDDALIVIPSDPESVAAILDLIEKGVI